MKLIAIALLLIACGAGCANVKPWQREALSDYILRAYRDLLADLNNEHMWFSREATYGGRGVGGGGCGCN